LGAHSSPIIDRLAVEYNTTNPLKIIQGGGELGNRIIKLLKKKGKEPTKFERCLFSWTR
jgi:hypothetical protein